MSDYLPETPGAFFFFGFSATSAPQPKCSLSKACPPDHFSLHIKSGAANVVGPKICFEGKTYVFNMVDPELTGDEMKLITLHWNSTLLVSQQHYESRVE